MTTEPVRPVRIEILARRDCPGRGITVALVERVVEETGVPVRVELIDMATESQAQRRRFLGSPSVRVDGRDVEPGTNGRVGFTLACRVYFGESGLQGWPDERWVRDALLIAAGQPLAGDSSPSERSSATSP